LPRKTAEVELRRYRFGSSWIAAESPSVGENYIILPITTKLQRLRRKEFPNTTAYVIVNGAGLIDAEERHLDASAIDLWEIRRALKPYAADGASSIQFDIYMVGFPVRRTGGTPHPISVLSGALLWGAIKAGFQDPSTSRYTHKAPPDWKSFVADFATPPSEEDIEAEAGVGDDQFKLYAVRTPLSRHLYGHFDDEAECVIHTLVVAFLEMKRTRFLAKFPNGHEYSVSADLSVDTADGMWPGFTP
jgi:hypothetical protein